MNKCNPDIVRPVLKYPGSKWRIAPWVISHFPDHETYVEPFGGGASILLRKAAVNREVYNDLDDELVNLFEVLRSRGKQLGERLKLTPFSRTEFNRCFEPCDSKVERARRAIVRSQMGYGSAGFNGDKYFSMTESSSRGGRHHEWNRYPTAIPAIVERLKPVIIEKRPAIEVMKQNDSKHALHYVDPPYVFDTRTAKNDYKYEMTDERHEELADCLHSLKGAVVLSGYPSPLYAKKYKGWKTRDLKTRAVSNKVRIERIWIKPVN